MKRANATLNVLLGVIIAVIIVLVATKAGSKLLATSDQAKNSFHSFVNDLKTLAVSEKQAERKSSVIILDDETILAAFTDSILTINVIVNSQKYQVSPYTIIVPRPKSCNPEGPTCLCLISSVETNKEESVFSMTPQEVRCENLNFPIYYGGKNQLTCSIGNPLGGVLEYTCEGGFLLNRGAIPEDLSHFQSDRRSAFVVAKEYDGIKIVELKP